MIFSVCTFNVQSILANKRRKSFSNAISTLDFSIIALTETWLTSDILESGLYLSNYQVYRSDRPTGTSSHSLHGGALLAVRRGLLHTVLPIELHGVAAVGCACRCEGKTVLIVVAYNPDDKSKYRWSLEQWNKLLESVDRLRSSYDSFFLMGVFNLPGYYWSVWNSGNHYEAAVLKLLDRHSLPQLVNFPTSAANSNVYDLVFTDSSPLISNLVADRKFWNLYSVENRPCSNHLPVSFEIMGEAVSGENSQKRLSFCNADYEGLNKSILENPFIGNWWSKPNVLFCEWYDWLFKLI